MIGLSLNGVDPLLAEPETALSTLGVAAGDLLFVLGEGSLFPDVSLQDKVTPTLTQSPRSLQLRGEHQSGGDEAIVPEHFLYDRGLTLPQASRPAENVVMPPPESL